MFQLTGGGPKLGCRACGSALQTIFADLGRSPIANALVGSDRKDIEDPEFPLCAYVCETCYLVQLGTDLPATAHFHGDYVYFSSMSDSWLKHARAFAQASTNRFSLGNGTRVIEIGSNDGYLLRFFKDLGHSVLGVDPAANCAREAAERYGVPTRVAFFGASVAREIVAESGGADLVVANNVLAHVPDLIDVVRGLRQLLKPAGVVSIEFPHVLELIRHRQFDTIYHEHYCYFSLLALEPILRAQGLVVFDVERLATHGGSLRISAARSDGARRVSPSVAEQLARERAAGLDRAETYSVFGREIDALRHDLLKLLNDLRREGHRIAAYGAPAKGNTLLNFCGIGRDLVEFTVDRSPSKQGRWLPGSRLPVFAPSAIAETKPDYVLVLPWNIASEIREQMAEIATWGGRFIVPIPNPRVVDR